MSEGDGKGSVVKLDRTVSTEGRIAGLKFTKGGVVLDDDAVVALKLVIVEVIAAKRVTEKDTRRLCGIMQYAVSAFE